jgi:hypothetical protein
MVCTNCGAPIPAENFRCAECGKRRTTTEVLAEPLSGPAPPLKGFGGWLVLLVSYLVFLVPISAALALTRGAVGLFVAHSMRINTSPAVLFAWIGGLTLTAFGLYAGMLLWKERPRAVATTKAFLSAWLLFGVVSALLSHASVADRSWELANGLLWFAVWYSYLVFSKRVANTYV